MEKLDSRYLPEKAHCASDLAVSSALRCIRLQQDEKYLFDADCNQSTHDSELLTIR
jgi:hypothetical protein